MISTIDIVMLRNEISELVRHVTCSKCCKYYVEPETAACGHSLCHKCWVGRRVCLLCSSQLDRGVLQLNKPLQIRTENTCSMTYLYAQNFNIKLDTFVSNNIDLKENDNTKNVKDWLANSQNCFSAPISEESNYTQCINTSETVTTKVQVHDSNKKTAGPVKVVHKIISQLDWDLIEEMPDVENEKKPENIIGPKDIEPFNFDDKEYSSENPRRSTRKRKAIYDDVENVKSTDIVENTSDKCISTNSKVHKIKEYWNTVKRMKKDLNKPSKISSKLDVSIENCKRIQDMSSKSNTLATCLLEVVTGKKDLTQYKNIIEAVNKPSVLRDKNQQEKVKLISEQNISSEEKQTITLHTDVCPSNSTLKNSKDKDIIENNGFTQTDMKDLPAEKLEKNTEKDTVNEKQLRTPFIKKSVLCPKQEVDDYNAKILKQIDKPQARHKDSDDIEIIIKTGNTVTNIVIKQKENDVHFKVMTDRGVQTSPQGQLKGPDNKIHTAFTWKNISGHNIDLNLGKNQDNVIQIKSKNILDPNEINTKLESISSKKESTSSKKNTASAETQTVDDVLSVNLDKELSNPMESSKDLVNKDLIVEKDVSEKEHVVDNIAPVYDVDIFDTESIKENLGIKHAPSEILIPTVRSKKFTQIKSLLKRKESESISGDISSKNKKMKFDSENKQVESQHTIEPNSCIIPDSVSVDYDTVISQVFAEGMQCIRKSANTENRNTEFKTVSNKMMNSQKNNDLTLQQKENVSQKSRSRESRVLFIDSEKQNWDGPRNLEVALSVHRIDQLTPNIDNSSTHKSQKDIRKIAYESITVHDNDDSDRSVVEETPEKNISFPRIKQKTNTTPKELKEANTNSVTINTSITHEKEKNVTGSKDLTDKSVQDEAVIEKKTRNMSFETPMSIDKFTDSIKHNSTPVARKSLNFDNDFIEDLELLCPTDDNVAKNTQEKEFMMKAFECTPNLNTKSLPLKQKKKYCIAGSCLNEMEKMKLIMLCKEHNWTYVDKYTEDLTHLVVSVDKQNKAPRSVKYMCALAASRWIISYAWVEKCLAAKRILNEGPFEVLDSTGTPGPMRSRTTNRKLFTGFKFFCMPPYTILDVDTFKVMLESAGGQVVDNVQEVKVTENTKAIALLLAEPENTQEDKFIDLATERSIVPVNYEWVLNSLGNYALESIYELLLCPSTLLPPATSKWPYGLLEPDYDD